MKKIGNTSFQEETIKKMTLKEFKDTYKGILKGQDLKKVYDEVTETVEEEEAKKDFEDSQGGDNLG